MEENEMKRLILGSMIAVGFSLSAAPRVSLALPVSGGTNCIDWGDGWIVCEGSNGGGGGTGAGGGGAGGATCYNYVGDNVSCEAAALGYFYRNCSYNCH
jgi:hypothetical protein